MSTEKIRMFLSVLSQLKQKIIWKWDGEIPAEIPNNILMMKWLPQNDLLAHLNMRLFISHCGHGSVEEAKFHSVPILGIPFIGDQPMNAKNVAENGWGIYLPFDDVTELNLQQAINEILNNQTYFKNVKRISNIFRDRPHSPLRTAIYWIEYVLRYNGARHIRSPAAHLNFYQSWFLDVTVFLLITLILSYYILKFIFKYLMKGIKFVIFKIKPNNKSLEQS